MRYSFLLTTMLLCYNSTFQSVGMGTSAGKVTFDLESTSIIITADQVSVGDKSFQFNDLMQLSSRIEAVENQVARLEYALIAAVVGLGYVMYDTYFKNDVSSDEVQGNS